MLFDLGSQAAESTEQVRALITGSLFKFTNQVQRNQLRPYLGRLVDRLDRVAKFLLNNGGRSRGLPTVRRYKVKVSEQEQGELDCLHSLLNRSPPDWGVQRQIRQAGAYLIGYGPTGFSQSIIRNRIRPERPLEMYDQPGNGVAFLPLERIEQRG